MGATSQARGFLRANKQYFENDDVAREENVITVQPHPVGLVHWAIAVKTQDVRMSGSGLEWRELERRGKRGWRMLGEGRERDGRAAAKDGRGRRV